MTIRRSIPALICAIAALSVANAQTTFTNAAAISVTGNGGSSEVKASGGYPSTITIPNTVTGTITNIAVVLNQFNANGSSATGTQGLGILLVHSDSGHNLEIMGAPSDGNESFTNVPFYISDTAVVTPANAFGYMPSSGFPCGTSGGAPWSPTSGTMDYRPSSYFLGASAGPTYPTPAPGTINRSGPCSPNSGTLMGTFGSDTPSGTWQLYVDDGESDIVAISGGWSLILTVSTSSSPTTTTLTSNLNPSFASSPSNSVTLTATVSSSGGTVAGTVAFTDGGVGIAGCGGVAISGGMAQCTTTFSPEGFHGLTATTSPTGSFIGSSGTLTQFVENHASTGTTNQYCNTGGITVGSGNVSGTDTQPYPSVINVPSLSATTVSTVSLVLKGLSMTTTSNMSMLLVSPDGTHALDFFDNVGAAVQSPTSGTTTDVTFSDSGVEAPTPEQGGGLAGPTADYLPTAFRSSSSFAQTPSPAPQVPATFRIAGPGGSTPNTFLETFGGATASGPWSLFVYYQGLPNAASITGGWCITLTPASGTSTTTTVSGSPNSAAPVGATTGSLVTITATVKVGSTPVTEGTVTFTENGAPVAGVTNPVSVGSNGQASFTTSLLPQGDHSILATYADPSGTFNDSFGMYVQRVDNAPTVTVNGTQVSYCNAGAITLPDGSIAAGFPNPSNINVGNLFGTIKTVTVSLNGYHEAASASFLDSVLVGPAGTKAASLDFFSGVGGSSGPLGPFNLTIADSGGGPVPTSAFAAGTYKPTSYNPTDTFTASASGFYSLPGTYNYSVTVGSSTFFSIYGGTNPIGNWDLYMFQNGDSAGGGLNTGWCLNFTQNPPALAITKHHSGNFEQGQQGAQFTIVVTNNGPGTSGGPIPVSVVDVMPAGLVPAASPGSGTDWSCTSTGQTITCTNSDVVASGSSYPTLTLNVNVASNAPGGVTNTASVNGSGNTAAVNSNTDSVTIVPPPFLALTKTPSGTFTQGSGAIWNLIVSNTAPGSTTSGTVTVVDTLPANYTLNGFSGTGWGCGAVTVTVTCTSTTVVSGGNSYPTLVLTVNVPANSAISVTNNAVAFGGGDTTHTTSGNGATAFSTVTVTQVPATINIGPGNNQGVAINTAFPTNLSVTVLDAGSVTISGATVTFTAPASGASGTFAGGTNAIPESTNSSGVATASVYTANSTVGGPYNINVSAGSITNHFSETNLTGAAASMTANAGTTPQTATINTAFANALAVTVKDAGSNPVSGVNVTFTAPSTGASGIFSNSTTTITVATNVSGVASAPFTANATAGGPYNVTAAASGLTTLNFSLSNTAGAAASMTANAGTTPQSATINTAFGVALAVTVKDAGSNPLSGVNVTFTAPASGASGTFSNSTNTIIVATNGSGVASAPFTANGTSGGPYTVTAAASGLTTINFSLTNTGGTPASMTANAGTTPQSATINTAFGVALAVTVKDASSNPLSGVNVTFTAPSSGASGTFSNSTTTIIVATNGSGVASAPFTANGTSGGPYTVTAAASGLTTVNFSLTNTAGAPASMTANAGTTPQSATINTAFGVPLAVTVKDAGSNPISGVNVTFTAPATGASGTFSNSTRTITVATNASGVASAPFTANGTSGGPYTVTAAASGLTTINFSLTNTAGTPASMTANAGTTPQTAAIDTSFGVALAVTVKDAGSNPLSGVNVTFTAPSSGASGTFSNSTTTITVATNGSGVASAPFTANGTAGGPYNATATASGLTAVNFSLTNTVGAPASMTANAGTTPQSATVNTAFANALAVTVKDAGSNPLSGVNVTFTAPSTGASGTFSNTTNTIVVATNGSGVASAPFTANGTSGGPYNVTAAASGLTTVNFSLTNTAVVIVSPTVVSYSVDWGGESYSVIGTPRNRLPWQITGITVVFSQVITTADVNSLSGTGVTTTGFSGLGTNTLTWTISPLALGNFTTLLAGSGPNAIQANGNGLSGGAGYTQGLKILYGDFNDDGVVNSQDGVGVNNASKGAYNLLADMNGDGVVNVADVRIVAARIGTSLP